MSRGTIMAIYIFLVTLICGCASQHDAHVTRQSLPGIKFGATQDSSSKWALDTLAPKENTLLINGQTDSVSIHMAASGDGNYLLEMSANGKRFRPFKLKIAQGLGKADFSEIDTWFVKIRGKRKSETVTVSLYGIEESASGKIEVRTLLKQFKRRYDVVCDNKQWKMLLFFERHLGFCSCKLVR